MKYSPTLPTQKNRQPESTYKNRVVNTKRTILSPFTKEYRVFATLNGIPLFFGGVVSKVQPLTILVQFNNVSI
ncbi:hypothetical protein ACOSQ3_020861 [Xanthoceras sorbifolium]